MIVATKELKRGRLISGLTQAEMGERAGVPKAIISNAERGLSISAPAAKRLADALGRGFEEVFEIRDKPLQQGEPGIDNTM